MTVSLIHSVSFVSLGQFTSIYTLLLSSFNFVFNVFMMAQIYRMSENARVRARGYTQQYRSSKGRAPRIQLELPGDREDKELLVAKMRRVAELHGEAGLNRSQILNTVLDYWLRQNTGTDDAGATDEATPQRSTEAENVSSFLPCTKEDADQQLFVTSVNAVRNLVFQVQEHTRKCKEDITGIESVSLHGHTGRIVLECANCYLTWSSSPYLPNGKFLVNFRMAHGYLSSGLLPSQYERFCEASGLGKIGKQYMKNSVLDDYYASVKELADDSMHTAVLEEVASYEDLDGINMITDARHSWRRNARFTDVVCIGDNTHKVLHDAIISKDDDPITQRHELIGVKRIYDKLDNIEGGIYVKMHGHDRNMSVNKFLREQREDTVNQNDTWHMAKSFEKHISKVAKGTKREEGKTWSDELSDKVAAIRTHAQYSIRNAKGDACALRKNLDNIVNHYKNDHSGCRDDSRCKIDGNYRPSKMLLSPFSEGLLQKAIVTSDLYKHAEDYVWAMDTYYVESFNNVLNIFQDKRIAFDEEQFKMRSQLAILHWNNNVDREFTSVWQSESTNLTKKTYKPVSTTYLNSIWSSFMDKVYA